MEEKTRIAAVGLSRYVWKLIVPAVFFLSCVGFFSWPRAAEAASLYLSPSSGTYKTGQSFSVGVYVSSADQAVNAYMGAVSFPNDLLEVTNLSKNGITSFWAVEPAVSGSTVNFEGVALNPGYTGTSGRIATITFRAKAEGTASVSFASGSVLANDGLGTNILTGMGGAHFTLGAGAAPSVSNVPAPRIASQTHPDQDAWYAAADAVISWSVPSGIDAVRTLIGNIPNAAPTISYAPPISSKAVSGLEDGTWYFHAQFRRGSEWGGVTHYRLQIDTEDPERFEIREVPRKHPSDPAQFIFDAFDRTSGVDRYEVRIDGGEPVAWVGSSATSTYEASVHTTGLHTLSARVFDRAGNWRDASTTFVMEAVPAPVQPVEVTAPVVSQEVPQQRIIFWIALGSIGTLLLILLLSGLYLLQKTWMLRRRLRKAIRNSRRMIDEAFQGLSAGSNARETEKRVMKALDDISKLVK